MIESIDDILLPPPFALRVSASGDALEAACSAAAAGADPGTLVWTPHTDLFDCAVVLAPEMPLVRARPVIHVAMVALGDTLAAAGPPNKPIAYRWPGRIAIDGADVGGVRMAMPQAGSPDAVPDWLAVGVMLRTTFDAEAPGRDPGRTALREEGFGDIGEGMLVESFSRHLLYWMDRWETDGFTPIAEAWLSRLATGADGDGPKHGLDPATGDLLILDGTGVTPRRVPLAAVDWTV